MAQIDNQSYLKDHQYKTSANLEARIALHRDFSVNPYPWQRWVFDRLALEAGMRVLEVGCGPADLWTQNADRLPQGLEICLADYSLGMVQQARQNVAERAAGLPGAGLTYLNLDVQHLPFLDQSFDRVVANHMLYHVPDIGLAVSELQRVLRPGGRLIAATNGMDHMQELAGLVMRFQPPGHNLDWWRQSGMRRFSLENALETLSQSFEMVELQIYEDGLQVTRPEPILAYIASMSSLDPRAGGLPPDHDALRVYLEEYFAGYPVFPITKSGGVAIAIRE